MSVYLIATIETKPEGMAGLAGAIAEMIPILKTKGWTLFSAFTQRTGLAGWSSTSGGCRTTTR